jgi:signal transduction histidine kinase
VLQLAHALSCKWQLTRQAKLKLDEISQMVAWRTRELEAANCRIKNEAEERLQLERQFRHSQKMEAIGQLAAGVAHDFNNILTIIHGHASMLGLRLGNEGPHSKSLAEIRRSAERAANLVRQLLAFSRKQIMQRQNLQISEVIHSVATMLRQLVGEHIAVETLCAPGLPPIFADRGMLEQVIANLAVNARDAIGKEGRITVQSSAITLDAEQARACPDARPGRYVCLTVSDTGCGIKKEALAHIFEPFFTTKEVGKGTGLGLATVYGIVKQHDGWIQVISSPGQGATFHIFFPVSDRAIVPPVPNHAQPPRLAGTETILIAEDEPDLREMVCDVLTHHGYQVLAARSGPAARDVWAREKTRIDLLLTDLVMPGGMTGTDLAAELQLHNPKLKIIYTTGYSPGAFAADFPFRAGANFLPKPYEPNQLVEIVRRCLDN